MNRISFLLVFLVGVELVCCFPNGAPTEACIRGLVPNHTPHVSQDPRSMPFAVYRENTADGVRVTIESLGQRFFKGFMIQAQQRENGRPAPSSWGSWQPVQHVNQLLECSSVTHADRSQKAAVTVTWTGRQEVDVRVTILEDYSTFWSNVLARELPSSGGSPSFSLTGRRSPFGARRLLTSRFQ